MRWHRYTMVSVSCRVSSHALAPPSVAFLTHFSYCHSRFSPRSLRSKLKSMPMNSSPSSDTHIRPCFTRRTSGYSSGSMSRACWMRQTKEPSSLHGTSWSALRRLTDRRWPIGFNHFGTAGPQRKPDVLILVPPPRVCVVVCCIYISESSFVPVVSYLYLLPPSNSHSYFLRRTHPKYRNTNGSRWCFCFISCESE